MITTVGSTNAISGTTQVLGEVGVKTVQRNHLHDVPEGLLSATRVGYSQSSIYDFLAKPVLLETFEWNTQNAGDVLVNKSLPQDAFSKDVYSSKLKGFLGFRGTAVVRLQVNGTKFQRGRLLMVFIPQGNVANSFPGMRLRSLKSATQLPRVELDLGTETEVVMEIPYISPTPFFNFNDSSGPIGRVAVLVYSSLSTGTGSAIADVSMWVSFKDVELVAPAVAQMNDRKPKKKVSNPSERESLAFEQKPLSGGLSLMAKAASSFAKVPLLSSIAGPASWALNCMAGAASAFGYAKPSTEDAVVKVLPVANFHQQNFNGVDMFPNMGLDATNKVSVLPGYSGTDIDEMSLNHLVQIPSFVTSTDMLTSDAAGTLLLSIDVHPQIFDDFSTVNLWSCVDKSPVSYFSSFFRYWRGSLIVTLKLVKTPFHSGRILAVYNPAPVSPTIEQSAYLLREIIDIRESNEYRFVIPYTSTKQYCTTRGFTTDSITPMSIGKFNLYVLNELVAPDTVSNGIDILMELSGGPDFELALPTPFSVAPIINTSWAAQMSDIVPPSKASSNPQENEGVIAIGSAMIEKQSLEPALHCIGEKCNSILQLMKRYCSLNAVGFATSGFISADFRPFIYGYCKSSDLVANPFVPTGDFISLFGPCFAYSRGSIRVCGVPVPNGNTPSMIGLGPVVAYPSSDDTIFKDGGGFGSPGESISFQPSATASPVGMTIPAYTQLHCRLNRASYSSAPEPVDIYTSPMRARFKTAYGGDGLDTKIYRAAGDDFALGYFIGVPLVTDSVTF